MKKKHERKKEGKTRQSLEGNQNRPPTVGIKKNLYTRSAGPLFGRFVAEKYFCCFGKSDAFGRAKKRKK